MAHISIHVIDLSFPQREINKLGKTELVIANSLPLSLPHELCLILLPGSTHKSGRSAGNLICWNYRSIEWRMFVQAQLTVKLLLNYGICAALGESTQNIWAQDELRTIPRFY